MTVPLPAIAEVPLAALRPAPDNPRKINPERLDQLKRSLEADREMLAVRPLIALPDGTVVCGNQRLRAARALGWETIPAVLVELDERRAKEWMLRDNNAFGDWVPDDLAAMLGELRLDGSDLDLLGFDERELQQLLDRLGKDDGLLGVDDDVLPLPDEPVTQRGDLWLLGDHRVLCGDATDRHDVTFVCDGEQPRCLWTDPPYGVEYVGGTRDHLTIKNDHPETLDALLRDAFAAIDEALAPGAALYVCEPMGANSVTFRQRFVAQGWRFHETLVWVKEKLVPGHSDYHARHETLIFGYKSGSGRHGRGSRGWYGGDDQATVFEFPSAKRNDEHPTAKPVALVEAMLSNSSRTGDLVLDGFLGSGSTLIACEQRGRRCAGIDIDPRYVDVAVQRWERLTGRKAERIASAALGGGSK